MTTKAQVEVGHAEHGPHLAHHFDTPLQQYDSGKLGMWLFLATEVLLFGGLFCAYAIYRGNHPEIFIWAHTFLDKGLGATNTVILLCSSLTMAWAVRAAQLGQRRSLIVLLSLTLLCACGFLGIKYVEYRAKWEHGLLWAGHYDPQLEGHAAGELAGAGPIAGHGTAPVPQTTAPAPADSAPATPGAPASTSGPGAPHPGPAPADASSANAAGKGAPTQHGAAVGEQPGGAPAPTARASGATGTEGQAGGASHRSGAPNAPGHAAPQGAGSASGQARTATDAQGRASASTAPDTSTGSPASADAAAGATAALGTERSTLPAPAPAPSGLAPRHGAAHGETTAPRNARVFFSIYFLMTGLHGLHVLAGMAAIAWVLRRAARGDFGPAYFTPVDLVGLYWHLVDLIWIFLFPLLYLIH